MTGRRHVACTAERVRMRPVEVSPLEEVLREEYERELQHAVAILSARQAGVSDRDEIAALTGLTHADATRTMVFAMALLRGRQNRLSPPPPPSPDEVLDRAKWSVIRGPEGVAQLHEHHGVDYTAWRALAEAGLWRVSDVAAATDTQLLALPHIGQARLRRIRAAVDALTGGR